MQKGNNKIILDAYNANPSSMKAAIENFARMKNPDKILALGAMAELGTTSIEEHESLIEEIKKYPWKDVLLVGGDFQQIKHSFHQFTSSQEAGEWMKGKYTNAYLLIKGSRSMQMEKVLDYL
jgi:UDP-N-acetylmuramoyl-tripeptide--D-alanyl-D-alanine ligase